MAKPSAGGIQTYPRPSFGFWRTSPARGGWEGADSVGEGVISGVGAAEGGADETVAAGAEGGGSTAGASRCPRARSRPEPPLPRPPRPPQPTPAVPAARGAA